MIEAARLEPNPIITRQLFDEVGVAEDGDNINGPSLVRLPEWLPIENRAHPEATYYLYFAHHQGGYIRMAWASSLLGPWQLYQPGQGVLWLRPEKTINIGNGLILRDHVGSPDVHLDDANKCFILYFHAPSNVTNPSTGSSQCSFVATSANGLTFTSGIKPVMLTGPYLRAFHWHGALYGVLVHGDIVRAPNPTQQWQAPAGEAAWELNQGRPLRKALEGATAGVVRHVALKHNNNTLTVFFTCIGHTPERIVYARVRLTQDWHTWQISEPVELLCPKKEYEGANEALTESKSGLARGRVNQLRDPCFFEDTDGSEYLLYSVAGEQGIAIAALSKSSPVQDG